MSSLGFPTLAPSDGAALSPAFKEASPDSLARRLLRSPRIVIGGGVVLLVALTCILTLPITLRDRQPDGQSNPLYFDQQNSKLSRHYPAIREVRDGVERFAAELWFGTDPHGRSLLARCLLGGTISLGIGIAAAAISVILGVSVGLIAGYRGGTIDSLLMRSVDILYGLPYILLIILLKIALEPALAKFSVFNLIVCVIAIVFVCWRILANIDRRKTTGRWGAPLVELAYVAIFILLMIAREFSWWEVGLQAATANLVVLFLAIGLVSWLTMARVIRGQVLSLRAQPFIEACRASGLTEWRIFTRHLLPNLIGPITVYATLTVPQAILQESFLSFLGIGIQKPVPTWGSLASDGLMPALNPIHHYWYMLLTPCLLLSVTLLSLNFFGDGLRDVFDPKRDAAKV